MGKVSDIKQAVDGVVISLGYGSVDCGCSQTRWQQVGQTDVGCCGSSVVSDDNLEGNNITFIGCAVAAGECFDSDQIGHVVDRNGFFQIITNGGRIGLVTGCRCGDVGDHIAALSGINGALQRQRCRGSNSKASDIEQASHTVVAALRESSVIACRG